jgi:hypothetical protein
VEAWGGKNEDDEGIKYVDKLQVGCRQELFERVLHAHRLGVAMRMHISAAARWFI